MGKKVILPAILVLIITIALISFFLVQKKNASKIPPAPSTSRALPKEVTILLTDAGFSPSKVSIQKGTAVRWKNKTKKDQSVNSNDHPTNKKHVELNFGIFKPEASFVSIFSKTGNYGYHNYLAPEQKGEITVTN